MNAHPSAETLQAAWPNPPRPAQMTEEARRRRRAEIAPGAAAGVTEDLIQDLVAHFYAAVRADPALGPIFDAHVQDWPEHLAKLSDFWSSVTLMTGRFKGAPMPTHLAIPGLDDALFARWLDLWTASVTARCPPAAAALFRHKAEMIAQSLRTAINVRDGRLPVARDLPRGVKAYARTATFTEATVPSKLLQSHSTAENVWGRIVVEAGALEYTVTDPRRIRTQTTLTPEIPGIVEPTILHEVRPLGEVRFHVAFHR